MEGGVFFSVCTIMSPASLTRICEISCFFLSIWPVNARGSLHLQSFGCLRCEGVVRCDRKCQDCGHNLGLNGKPKCQCLDTLV